MPVNISRLRLWFAIAAIALAFVVGAFYFYGRMRVRRALVQAPQRLGVNVQQSTQGFSLSKSEAGRTIFTVHASHEVQYKEGGKASLRDVNIVVYGPQANRYDQIYGAEFEYDPQSGLISARGDVHIDLEGNATGPVSPDQAAPLEMKNPVHLKTSGLVFNQKTGVAHTDSTIEFRVAQASGWAVGATYDSKAAMLTLSSRIEIRSNDPNPVTIKAQHGEIIKSPDRTVLQVAEIDRAEGKLLADQLTVFLRDDQTVEHILAAGDVRGDYGGKSPLAMRAPRADAWITPKNAVTSATLSGGVALDATGAMNMQGTAGRVQLSFAARNLLNKVTALDGVKLLQQPAHASPTAHPLELTAATVEFPVKEGRLLGQAVTSGPAQITILPVSGASGSQAARSVATAGHFEAAFDRHNRLQQVVGFPEAKVVSSAPGFADKTSTSDRLEVALNPAGGVASLVQDGRFHYTEPASGAAPARAAWAEHARYTPADQTLVLTGSPRVVDGGMTTTAQTIRLAQNVHDGEAAGDVKTTYSDLKPQPGGALLAASDPIHVTARQAQFHEAVAVYSGGPGKARLWQGSNIVEAPTITFDRQQRTLKAGAAARSASEPSPASVSTVFVQQDKNGKVSPVNVTSATLTYVDAQRLAHFEGGVVMKGADSTMTASRMDVYLQAQGQTGTPGSVVPSQIDHIVAEGQVVVQQPNRRATGTKLVFTASDGKFVMTGGPPSIFDAERGTITGDSLTFNNRDGRVLVEGSNSSPTLTQTRVAK